MFSFLLWSGPLWASDVPDFTLQVEPYALEEQEPYTTLSSTAAFEGSLEEILFPQVEEMHEAAEELLAE